MKKSDFITRLKKCYKSKGYTQEKLAEELNMSVNSFKEYFKKQHQGLPNIDIIKKLAEILEVDVSYLLFDSEFEKIDTKRLQDITHLSDKACEKLAFFSKETLYMQILDSILSYDDIERVLLDIYQYQHCHNKEVHIKDNLSDDKNNTKKLYGQSALQKIFKSSATDSYGKMLDYLYQEAKPNDTSVYAFKQFTKMLIDIKKTKDFAIENEKYYNTLLSYVDSTLKSIRSLSDNTLYQQSADFYINGVDILIQEFCNDN